jgi:hypothetical protein
VLSMCGKIIIVSLSCPDRCRRYIDSSAEEFRASILPAPIIMARQPVAAYRASMSYADALPHRLGSLKPSQTTTRACRAVTCRHDVYVAYVTRNGLDIAAQGRQSSFPSICTRRGAHMDAV